MNDAVYIDDSNGSGRRLKLFRSPSDGDIHVSIVEPGDRLGLNSVRICTNEGNPRQGEIHWGLKEAFEAALNRGYGEDKQFINWDWEGCWMRLNNKEDELEKLRAVALHARGLYEICADLPIDFPSADRFVWTMGELKDALVVAGY